MIADIIIVLIFICEMVQGWRKGILYMLGVVAALALAFFLARNFALPLSEQIQAAADKQKLQQEVESRLNARLLQDKQTNGSILDKLDIPAAYRDLLAQKEPQLLRQLETAIRSGAEEGQRSLHEALHQLSGQIFQMGSQALAFLLIFSLSFFLLRLLLRLITKVVNKIPFIGGLNRRLGVVMGFLIAVLVCGLLAGLLPAVKDLLPTGEKALASSKILPVIVNSSLFHYLASCVLWR